MRRTFPLSFSRSFSSSLSSISTPFSPPSHSLLLPRSLLSLPHNHPFFHPSLGSTFRTNTLLSSSFCSSTSSSDEGERGEEEGEKKEEEVPFEERMNELDIQIQRIEEAVRSGLSLIFLFFLFLLLLLLLLLLKIIPFFFFSFQIPQAKLSLTMSGRPSSKTASPTNWEEKIQKFSTIIIKKVHFLRLGKDNRKRAREKEREREKKREKERKREKKRERTKSLPLFILLRM